MSRAQRWCFTINNPTEADWFWRDLEEHGLVQDKEVKFFIVQLEKGENGTPHFQGYIIFKDRLRMSQLKKINARAHWEVAKGTVEQNIAYCSKEDTYTGGLRYRWGSIPERAPVKKRDERLQDAAEELDALKVAYKRPAEIPSMTLMQCGFIPAMKELTADILGPYRPELRIITMVGPPGTGKSWCIQHFFPEHGRCIVGNSGVWFQQPLSEVMIFEEFAGQIQLQRMLQYLDPYPLALEIKGGMRPAMYKTVIITSNTSPRFWYSVKDDSNDPKRMDAIHALWDRIGYSDGSYVPVRTCGTYLEAPAMMEAFGMSAAHYIQECRRYFFEHLHEVVLGYEAIYTTDEEDN